MSETTKRCQVEMHDGKPCGLELYDDECCIFHSKKEDKDTALFAEGLEKIFSNETLKVYDFTRFTFPEGILFPLRLSKPAIFRKAVFTGEAYFEDIGFERCADFSGAVFESRADFGAAVFEDHAEFAFAVFKGEAGFQEVTFGGEATFGDAVIEGKAFFREAAFHSRVDFSHAVFKANVDFLAATFKAWAAFYGTTFGGDASFADASFEDGVDFWGAVFEDGLWINAERHKKKGFCDEVDFGSVKFSNPEKVEFQKVELSMFRFLETDLRRVHFVDVNWNRDASRGRNRVYDEVSPADDEAIPGEKPFDYALIAQLYRRLRANYEENLRYSEAGDFYIGEMEMTRKAEKNIFKKLPLLFYKAISNYGESYYRPLCWIAAILVIFPLLFMFAGIQPVSPDPNNPKGEVINYRLDFSSNESFLPTFDKLGDYWTSFLYTMSVFSFIRDKKYTTIDNCGRTLFVAESILSPVTLAFFLLALRRRFKR